MADTLYGGQGGSFHGDPPGALSNLGEVTPGTVAGLVAGPIGSALGSVFGGPIGGIGGGFLGNALAALMSGKDIGQAALSLPASIGGYALGNIGQGLGSLGSMALGLLGSNLIGSAMQGNQGTAPDIGASIATSGPEGVGPVAGAEPTGETAMAPSPVAEAVAAPMLSSQPFGWYSQGMKRVNTPWVSQPGSQQLRYNQSGNYGGMKRV
jgi:hypothetical protein